MTENNTLFDLADTKERTRTVNGYVKSHSKDGRLHVDIDADVSEIIDRYCKLRNINRKRLVNQILAEKMNELKQAMYDDLPKEKLIELLMEKENAKH